MLELIIVNINSQTKIITQINSVMNFVCYEYLMILFQYFTGNF